jgi:hypothetical protein
LVKKNVAARNFTDVLVLSKYDTIHVFAFDAFKRVFKSAKYDNALLKHVALKSTIMA